MQALQELSYEYIALLKFLKQDYFTILITGRKKSGKSALMYHLLELIHRLNPDIPVYVINFPASKKHLLPEWLQIANKYVIDSLEDCVIGVEESALVALSRNWYQGYNKLLSQLLAISAHKRQRQVFVVQNLRLLDANVISLADALFVKPYSYTGYKVEREELREIIARAWLLYEMNGIVSFEEQKKYSVVMDLPDSPEPFLYRYSLPSFWTEELSRAWSDWSFKAQAGESLDESISEQIRQLVAKGYTLEQVLQKFSSHPNKKSIRVLYHRALRKLKEEGVIQ